MREFTMRSRPCTTSDGVFHPAEPLTTSYDEGESEFMAALTRRAETLQGAEHDEAIGEIRGIHELKALLGCRIMSDDERRELLGESMAPTEALAAIEAHELAHPDFPIPQKAKDEIAREGQTTLLAPEGTTPLPMPAAREEPLSDPDASTPGRFHHAEPGPETERQAAFAVMPRTGTQRRKVLDVLAASGDKGATDYEIAELLGNVTHRWVLATRRGELEAGGWVRNSGRTRKTDTGSDAVVWVLTERGRADWRPEAVAS